MHWMRLLLKKNNSLNLRKASYKNFCFFKASNNVSDIASQSALV